MLPVLRKSACVFHLTPLYLTIVRVPNLVPIMYDGMVYYSVCARLWFLQTGMLIC